MKAEPKELINQTYWHEIFEALDDVVFIINNRLEVEEINKKGCELLRLPKSEIIGKTCQRLFKCGTCMHLCSFNKCRLSGKTEIIVKNDLIKGRHFRAKTSPIFDEQGNVAKAVEILHEITEHINLEQTLDLQVRQNAAQNQNLRAVNEAYQVQNKQLLKLSGELEEKSKQLDHLFRYMNSGMAVYEAISHGDDFRFLKVNKAAEQITRTPAAELVGKSLLQKFPNMKKAGLFHALQEVYKTGDPIQLPAFYYQDEQRQGWRENFIYKLPNGQLVAIFTDVTDLKSSEIRYKESEKRFKFLSNITFEGILVHENKKVIDINESFTRLTGYTRDELIGNDIVDICVPFKEDKLRIAGKIKKQHANPYEIRVKRKDGTIFYAEIEGKNTSTEHENLRIVALRDISHRKEAEKQLRENEEMLKKQNEEYLAVNEELTESNNTILQINNHLSKANRDLDNFVYSVSHDLRAPITSTMGLARLILRSKSLNEIHQYGKLQEQSLAKLDNFIKDILNYSRNSRMEVEPTFVDFRTLINDIIEEQKFSVQDVNINFQMSFNTNIAFRSDLLRLRIIMNNLISNAIKFQNKYKNNPYVKISVCTDEEKAVLEVMDNGMGIQKGHMNRIFDMFYRANDVKPGSRIGLYITKDCVDKLQGKIECSSLFGQGTHFIVTIPAVKHPVTVAAD